MQFPEKKKKKKEKRISIKTITKKVVSEEGKEF